MNEWSDCLPVYDHGRQWLTVDVSIGVGALHVLAHLVVLGGGGFALLRVEIDMICFALAYRGLRWIARSYRLEDQEGGGKIACPKW